ncbi:unnamed protein product, partial [Coffea canephora]
VALGFALPPFTQAPSSLCLSRSLSFGGPDQLPSVPPTPLPGRCHLCPFSLSGRRPSVFSIESGAINAFSYPFQID